METWKTSGIYHGQNLARVQTGFGVKLHRYINKSQDTGILDLPSLQQSREFNIF